MINWSHLQFNQNWVKDFILGLKFFFSRFGLKFLNSEFEFLLNFSGFVCVQRLDPGTSCLGTAAQIPRWYFNTETMSCQQFLYLGCGGNDNRFETKENCQRYCSATQTTSCPNGLPGEFLERSITPRYCVLNSPNSCTAGYSCLPGTSGNPVCCLAQPSCPNGQPQMAPGGQNPIICSTVGQSKECSNPYLCVASTVVGVNVCCGQPLCPQGFITSNPLTGFPQACSPAATVKIEK